MRRMGLRLLRCCAGLCCALLASTTTAQTPSNIPNVPIGLAGTVNAIARQPNGGIVLGGSFTMIDGVPRDNLARLHADGTLDLQWSPSANGEVKALATNADGDVYAVGAFMEVNGQPRSLIAKLSGSGDGAVDANWNPLVDAGDASNPFRVEALALSPDGALFIGGSFQSIAGRTRRHIAKLSSTGTGELDIGWTPQLEHDVLALATDSAGAVYASISWFDPNALSIKKYEGGSGGTEASDWQPTLNGSAKTLFIGPDDSLYAVGTFRTPDYQSRELVRFSPSQRGAIDANWNPRFSFMYSIRAMAFDNAGSVYAANDERLHKLSGKAGTIIWDVPIADVRALVLTEGDALYAGGAFTPIGRQPGMGVARLATTDGAATAVVDAEVPGQVSAVARQPNGGIVVAGYFRKAGAIRRADIFRLTPDGVVDPDWNPTAVNDIDWMFDTRTLAVDADSDVYFLASSFRTGANLIIKVRGVGQGIRDPDWTTDVGGFPTVLAVDPRGDVYVGGAFVSVGGTPRHGIAKLSKVNGQPDSAWDATLDLHSSVFSIAIDASGSVYAGGALRTGGAIPGRSVMKLSGVSGVPDTRWSSEISGSVSALALTADDALYVAGNLQLPDQQTPIDRIVKLTRNGVIDRGWNAKVDDRLLALAVDANGEVYASGLFATAGGQPRTYLARFLGSNGAVDANWNPTPNGEVTALVMAGNELLAGGNFTGIGGQTRVGIAALPTYAQPLRLRAHSQRPLPPILRNLPPHLQPAITPTSRTNDP